MDQATITGPSLDAGDECCKTTQQECQQSQQTAEGECQPKMAADVQKQCAKKDEKMTREQIITKQLNKYIKDLEGKMLASVTESLEAVEEEENNIDEDVGTMRNDIEQQCADIIAHVDEIKSNMVDCLDEDTKKRQDIIKENKEQLQQKKETIESLLNDCKRHLMAGGEMMQTFFKEKCPSLSEFSFDAKIINSSFKTGVVDIPDLRESIGKLKLGTVCKGPSLKTTLITYPQCGLIETQAEVLDRFNTNNIIQDIRITPSGDIWITDEDSHLIVQYNREGDILGQVNATVYNECFVIDASGNFLVCDYWHCKVMRVTPTGDVSVLIDNLPSAPTGIVINHEGDIVVCLKDHKWIPIYSPDGMMKKGRMSIKEPKGEDFDEDDDVFPDEGDDGPGFGRVEFQIDSPYRIVQNSRHDYIVVDGKWRYQVVCLDARGNFRWKYIIQQLEDVYPYMICCDPHDNVIIADVESQRFHVINRDGRFIRYILFKELDMEDAWSMAFDANGLLLTGQDDGTVNIMDLKLKA